MVYHKGSYTSDSLAVYDRPVNRSGTAVLRQKGSVQVKGTEPWHLPHLFRKHSERHHHEEVGLQRLKLGQELRVLKLQGLEYRDIVLDGIFFHRTLVNLEASSAWLVSHSHHAHYLMAVLDEVVQWSHRKFRGSHIDDARLVQKT